MTHKIVKRGIKESDHPFNKIKEVHINTHGKNFRLILSPKRGLLHPKFKAYAVDGNGKETTVHVGKRVVHIKSNLSYLIRNNSFIYSVKPGHIFIDKISRFKPKTNKIIY